MLTIAWGQFSTEAQAQDSAEMAAVYGRGVHAYFSNRISGAEQLFSQVVQAGSTDPRVFYFRAMTRLRTGRLHEAEEDMKIGAAYEARDPGSRHSIGTALQRVQGQGRRTLERFRREGRLNRVRQRRQQTLRRYEQLDRRAPHVLRRDAPAQQEQPAEAPMQLTVPATSPIPSTAPADAEMSTPSAAPAAGKNDLFTDPPPNATESSETSSDMPAETESDSTDDFFGDPAPSKPAVSPPSAEGPALEDQDPFTDAAEIEDASADNTDPPMVDDAAASAEEVSEPAEEGDLFGDAVSEEKGTEEESTEEAPPVPESSEKLDDLFGGSDSSESPAEEDTIDGASESEDSAEEDPFGETPAEEAEQPETSDPEEAEPMEEPSESTESDDLFSGTSTIESTEMPSLTESDKVESSKLFGILGRAVGSTIPWKNIQLPRMSLSPAGLSTAEADTPEGIALGPVPTDQSVTPASAEEPVEMSNEENAGAEDLFGEAVSEDVAAEDPFGDDPVEVVEQDMENDLVDAEEKGEEASTEEAAPQSEDEDLFGDF